MESHLLTPNLRAKLHEQGYQYLKLLSVHMNGTERNLIYEPVLFIDDLSNDNYKAINDSTVRSIIHNELPHIRMFIQANANDQVPVAFAS